MREIVKICETLKPFQRGLFSIEYALEDILKGESKKPEHMPHKYAL
jgi:hypothetical protein